MRVKQKLAKTAISPEQQTRDFVRTVVMYGTVPREPNYWDRRAESLLLEPLPKGLDSACKELERMRLSATDLGEHGVISTAHAATTSHLQRLKTLIPQRAVDELYRLWRENHPECYL